MSRYRTHSSIECWRTYAGFRSSNSIKQRAPRMAAIRNTVLIVGVLAMLTGIIWMGQGTGYFPYPSYSFMINQMPWAYGGAALAALGFILLLVSRRM
jgi:hypothetical protein